MNSPNATLAALCIFNGLKLAPVVASPDPKLTLIGRAAHPRFDQCASYLTRFFDSGSRPHDYAPLEVFNGALAVAPWIRGAVGMLQHTLHLTDGIDIPDADSIDPAVWFADLHDLVITFRFACPGELSLVPAAKVQEAWEEPDFTPVHKDSRQFYLHALYAQARAVRAQDAFLVSAPAIARARQSKRPVPGQNLPFPDQVF